MSAQPSAAAANANFRKAVPPEPKRYAQCRNCRFFTYDADDYCDVRGQVRFRKAKPRCVMLGIAVTLGSVCDGHEFAHRDRSDR